MRPAVLLPVLVCLLTGVACGSAPPPKAHGPDESPGGATAGQPADSKANRPLTHEECQQLGQSIIDTCHGTNTRIATIEGWCSDVITGVSAGSWVSDCEKHVKYVDAVCFASTDSVRSMMDCDQAVAR
jgi:hypothetical protein